MGGRTHAHRKPLSLEPEKPASTPQTEPATPVRSPLTLAMEPDEKPLTLTSQAEPAREETPLSLDEPLLLGEPLDGAPHARRRRLLLDTPVAEAETKRKLFPSTDWKSSLPNRSSR